jgi:hypothetical protein
MPRLNEVFGIVSSIPKYTYVDRASLDGKLTYILTCDRHVVIYGPSKQGKTSLRKKNLPEENCIIVQCTSSMTLIKLYLEILRQIGSEIPSEITKTMTLGAEGKLEASGKVGLPFVASVDTKGEGSVSGEYATESTSEIVGVSSESLGYIASEITRSKKRVIIEDFHYLPEEEKRKLAFDLKAFWDYSVFLMIIGVWSEQNLLTYYNGDLSGRVEEIDVQWSNEELEQVLSKGEQVLNVIFDDKIRENVIKDANQNVGLLQRIAEKVCFENSILERQQTMQIIEEGGALDRARATICSEEAVRYRLFCEAVVRGFRDSETSELRVYQHIAHVFIDCSDAELRSGIYRETLLTRVQEIEARIRLSDLSAALNRIDKLQANRSVSPLVISYNPNTRLLQLVDKELLFYRKYGNPTWLWQEESDTAVDDIQLVLDSPTESVLALMPPQLD